jgi:putative ABC transport system permease protein
MNFNNWQRQWDLQAIYIPLKTGAVYLRHNLAVDNITLRAHDTESFQIMQARANQVLLARRNMEKNFTFQDVGAQVLEITTQMDEMMKKWSVTLLVIATVSLVVGGIGLFSTLLISINERMLEIGIRKSVGAKDSDIFFYFITEAITLSLIASTIGILLGISLTLLLGLAIKIQVPIAIISVYIGFGFALVIGILSGLYPALRAAKINPIQAIFYFE